MPRTVGSAADLIVLLDDVEGTTELVAPWEAETRALCDPALREAIEERGIELATP